MAIYVPLRKMEEDETAAIYEFGDVASFHGTLMVEKDTGKIDLIHIEAWAEKMIYVSRSRRKLRDLHEAGIYPEEAAWQA
jgi:hypothetical protein